MVFGLGLMGSGIVRFKNSLSQLIQTLIIIPHALIVFRLFVFPIVFPNANKIGFDFAFQFFFYLIGQVILLGVWAERIRFLKLLLFLNCWGLLVYFPVAYLSWHPQGLFQQLGLVDFAGGLVVHVTTGFSALAMTFLGKRRLDYYKLIKNYNNPLIFIGLCFLWLGWIGFNAGSALGFNDEAKIAIVNTLFAPMASLIVWFWVDLIHTPHRSYLSHLSMAIVAGLVMITPSAGFLSWEWSLLVGGFAGLIGNYSLRFMHKVFNQDDVMEVFSTHGLVGFWGTALAPQLVKSQISFPLQFLCVVGVALYSIFMTTMIIKTLGIKRLLVGEEQENKGLDLVDHGEFVENCPYQSSEG